MDGGADYNFNALSDQANYPFFFEWDAENKTSFPTFEFDAEHVPIGDSANMCMGLSWVMAKKRNQYDKYMNVKGFDECLLHASGRALWEPDYPTHGLNFKLWNQKQKKGDNVCSNGIYVDKSDMCFTYDIMREVCVLVKFQKDTSKNTYSWVYTGGCYNDNKAVHYVPSYPGETHTFKSIQFEVRQDMRSIEDSDFEEEVVEEEVAGEEFNEDGEPVPPKQDTPQQKVAKERAQLKEDAASGKLEAEGFYFFYHLFKFIAILSLVLSIVCGFALAYLLFKIYKTTDENRALIQ